MSHMIYSDFTMSINSSISSVLCNLCTNLKVDEASVLITSGTDTNSNLTVSKKFTRVKNRFPVTVYDPPENVCTFYPNISSQSSMHIPRNGISSYNKSYTACAIKSNNSIIGILVCEQYNREYVWKSEDIIKMIECANDLKEPVEKLEALLSLKVNDPNLQIINNVRDIILVYDQNATITYLSENVYSIGGYKPEDVIGKSGFDFVHPSYHEKAVHFYERLSQGIIDPPRDYLFKHKDGSFHWVKYMCYPSMKDGKLVEVISIITPVGEEKHIVEKLGEGEDRYRFLDENLREVVWAIDLAGEYLYLSPSVKHLLGYSIEETLNKNFDKLLTPGSYLTARNIYFNEMSTILKNRISIPNWSKRLELEFVKKNGSTVWTDVVIHLLHDKHKQLHGLIGILRDVSELHSALVLLSENTQQRSIILNNIKDIVMTLNASGMITFITPSFEEHTDYKVSELTGKNIFDLIHTDQKDAAASSIKKLDERTPDVSLDLLMRNNKDGYSSWTFNCHPVMRNDRLREVVCLLTLKKSE